MPGETGVTVVTMLVCFLILHARLRALRPPGIPCALRLRRAGGFWKKLARNCAARSRSRCCKQRCLKLNPWQLTEREGDLPVIPRESGVSSTPRPFGSITDAGGILDCFAGARNDGRGAAARRARAYSCSCFLPPMFFSLANTASTLRSSRCFSVGSNSASLRVVSAAGSRVAPP